MRTFHFFVAVLTFAAACGSKSAPTSTPVIKDPVPMNEGTASAEAAPSSATAVLASYERVRAALAADDMSSVPASARELETSARAATTTGPYYAAIADGASKLASAGDLTAARAAFGEVSQHLVALLASDTSLAKGQHVFECPMVSGYNKWVQPSENLENPYMGKRMLTCGGASSWE